MDKLRIAVDGPAGAGKSTVARAVAHRLGLRYLDTGAMYRAFTLKLIREAADLEDGGLVESILNRITIGLGEGQEVFLDGEDVTAEIRMPHVNELVSPVSAISAVRRRLVELQREMAAAGGGVIMEGRDIASKVIPDADFKFYLDASLEERARRRWKEQVSRGLDLSLEEVSAEIKNRDKIDSARKDSPLTIVADALVIDTTGLTIEEVVGLVAGTVNGGISENETG